jgi:hypothetical protein
MPTFGQNLLRWGWSAYLQMVDRTPNTVPWGSLNSEEVTTYSRYSLVSMCACFALGLLSALGKLVGLKSPLACKRALVKSSRGLTVYAYVAMVTWLEQRAGLVLLCICKQK